MSFPLILILVACVFRTAGAQGAPSGSTGPGTLAGVVRDENNVRVAGARVTASGPLLRLSYTDSAGSYRFSLPPGRYSISVARIGYAPVPGDSVTVLSDSLLTKDFNIVAAPLPLARVVISPGSYELLDESAPTARTVSRETLDMMPSLIEDVFRSLNRLPGMSGSDFGAKVRVRNGAPDENLVLLDGLELIEPFHLKDFDGALSILDIDALGGVNLATGGFGAQYGNRLTGIIDMKSASPREDRATAAFGLSLSNIRARSEGSFADDRGQWLLSARRGYLDIMLDIVGERDLMDPKYFDLFGKLSYELGAHHSITLHGLFARDKLRVTDEDNDLSRASSSYDNAYAWATMESELSSRISVLTLFSLSHLTWNRAGQEFEHLPGRDYEVIALTDRRRLSVTGIKQDWHVEFSPRIGMVFGGELRLESADYAYNRRQRVLVTRNRTVFTLDSVNVTAALAPDGNRLSAYGAVRIRPLSPLALEIGTRADRHSWTSQTTIAPRITASFDATASTVVRAAWGEYYQAHSLQDLSIVDGDTTFHGAERAEHRLLGVEHALGRFRARIELFERRLGPSRARYYNTDGEPSVVPEAMPDRLRFAPERGVVRGAELSTTFEVSARVRAAASYSLSNSKAHVDGFVTPRPFDERRAATMDLTISNPRGWSFVFAWTYHSGWPIVTPTYRIDTVATNSYAVVRTTSLPDFGERLGSYQRIDLRASRTVTTRRTRVIFFADLFNMLDHHNPRGYDYDTSVSGGTVVVERRREEFLGLLPSVGFRLEFR